MPLFKKKGNAANRTISKFNTSGKPNGVGVFYEETEGRRERQRSKSARASWISSNSGRKEWFVEQPQAKRKKEPD